MKLKNNSRSRLWSGALLFFLCVLIGMVSLSVEAQVKHPRVAELEGELTKQATDYLKARFPDVPFLVTVSLDPLFRYDSNRSQNNEKENLPYFDLESEEIRDEWDDPSLSGHALMARVKRALVTVSVPESLSTDEIVELKDSLSMRLGLIAARDEVLVQRRMWQKGPSHWTYMSIAGAVLFLAFFILFLIARGSVGRIANALHESQAAASKSAPIPSVAPPVPSAAERTEPQRPPGNLKLSDPLKTKEVISKSIQLLIQNGGFPTLEDMVHLDRLAHRSPWALGGLLTEFPAEMQKVLFGYSYKVEWLEALSDPGFVEPEILESIQRLKRNLRDPSKSELERLLICIWRLGDRRAEFMKELKQDEALTLLHHMPKSISVATAREAFPGNWGSLLDPNFSAKPLGPGSMERIMELALDWEPLRDFSHLEKYRHERELLGYLKTVEPEEEKDIYVASPLNSIIHSVRPPFYVVFGLVKADLEHLVPRVSIEDWALAMLNVPKNERKEFESLFTEKQKFLYLEKLRAHDSNPPDKARVGEAREKIGKIVRDWMSHKNQLKTENELVGQNALAA